jgi:hypothetical protein
VSGRRNFLAALLAMPAAVVVALRAPRPLYPPLRSNVYAVPRVLTEDLMRDVMDEMYRERMWWRSWDRAELYYSSRVWIP